MLQQFQQECSTQPLETPLLKTRLHLRRNDAEQLWTQCSDMTGASYRNLLKWKALPIAKAYVDEKVKEALAGTYNKLISAGPAVADRLLSIALDPATKSYAAVSACEAAERNTPAMSAPVVMAFSRFSLHSRRKSEPSARKVWQRSRAR